MTCNKQEAFQLKLNEGYLPYIPLIDLDNIDHFYTGKQRELIKTIELARRNSCSLNLKTAPLTINARHNLRSLMDANKVCSKCSPFRYFSEDFLIKYCYLENEVGVERVEPVEGTAVISHKSGTTFSGFVTFNKKVRFGYKEDDTYGQANVTIAWNLDVTLDTSTSVLECCSSSPTIVAGELLS